MQRPARLFTIRAASIAVALSLVLGSVACSSGGDNGAAGAAIPTRSASGDIEVTSPARGEQIAPPLTLRGRARVPEGVVHFRLRSAGQILAEGTATARASEAGQYGSFENPVTWKVPVSPATPAELEVYVIRAKDGVPDHVVTVPVLIR